MDPLNKDGVDSELENDKNDVDVYGVDDDESVDSHDLDGNDETDFDNLDDLDISTDDDAVDGKSIEDGGDETELLASLETIVSQLRDMITGGEGDVEGGDTEFSLDGEGGESEAPMDGELEDELGEAKETDGEELEESNGSLENPAAMNKDGIVDTKVVSGGNESAKMKTNGPKAAPIKGKGKPTGKEGVEDPNEINKDAAKAGTNATSKTNLPAAHNVLNVVKQMLSGNGKLIQAVYSGATLTQEAFDQVEYKVDGRTLKAIAALDEGLSDDFKTGMVPVFEKAVERKLKSIMESIVPQINLMVADEVVAIEERMIGQVDSYLDHVVETYFDENKTVIEEAQGVKVSNAFMQGMKALYESESIEVPTGKESLVEKLEADNDALKIKATALAEDVRKYKSNFVKARKENILTELTEGLSVSDADRVRSLAEKQTCKTLNEFKEAVSSLAGTIVESKTTNPSPVETLIETAAPKQETRMDVYTKALKRR